MELCHGELGRQVDWLSNLRWDTHKNNCADKIAHGTAQRGEKHGGSKLKNAQVLEIKRRLKNGESQASLIREFGRCQATINHIATGRQWGWLKILD